MASPDDKNGDARAILAILFLVAVGMFYFFASTSLSTIFGSHHSYRPAPESDGKVEIVLRYAHEPDNPKPFQWHLRIPHGYFESIIGDLESIGPKDTVFVSIKGTIGSAENQFVAPENYGQYSADTLYVRLVNTATRSSIALAGGCLSSTGNPTDLQKAEVSSCQSKNCSVYDLVGGWNVEYVVPHSLALNPTPVCQLLREFLELHTIKRDNILIRGN